MAITFESLNDSNTETARDLLLSLWSPNWNRSLAESYFSWRYLERPGGETLLALDRGRCIGIIDSFLRPYVVGDRRITVRETCDWFCLPQYRAFGVGLQLMRRMMTKQEPILSVGGTNFTLELLPKLKWALLSSANTYILPISLRSAAGLAVWRLWPWAASLTERILRYLPLALRAPRCEPPTPNARVQLGRPADRPPSRLGGGAMGAALPARRLCRAGRDLRPSRLSGPL